MLKSVFSRYLCAFAVIILLSFTLLTVILSATISDYGREERNELVRDTSESVSAALQIGLTEISGYESLAEIPDDKRDAIRSYLSFLVGTQEIGILLCDNGGNLLASTSGFLADGVTRIPSENLTDTDNNDYFAASTTLYDCLSVTSVVSGTSVKGKNGNVIGMLFACVPENENNELISVLQKAVFMSSLWMMLAATVAAYFISDRIAEPLKSVVRASRNFAKGDFNARVPIVSGRNEITELAEAFNEMAESIASMEENRNTFLCNVAHDLRTPMTTISGFIDGFTSGAIPPEKQGYYLNLISDEIHRLSRLVSQILEVSRYEPGRKTLNRTEFDICEMARIILLSFESKLDEKEPEVDFDSDEENMLVNADKDAIYQVIYNLCDNAVKFLNPHGTLSFGIHRRGGKVEFSITNSGDGIPKEDLPNIFDRFYKSDKSRGKDKSGFGIGLFIVKSILTAHGENVYAESEAGKYCRFVFTLPAVNAREKNDG